MRRLRDCVSGVNNQKCYLFEEGKTEGGGEGKGHGTASETRRKPIPGGLGIASLLCTVPVTAPQPLPLEHRGYSSQFTFHQTFRWHRAGAVEWCEGLS